MSGRLLLVLLGAAVVGVAGGYLVTEGVPWPVPVTALLVAAALGVFTIRQRVADAISAARAKTRR